MKKKIAIIIAGVVILGGAGIGVVTAMNKPKQENMLVTAEVDKVTTQTMVTKIQEK